MERLLALAGRAGCEANQMKVLKARQVDPNCLQPFITLECTWCGWIGWCGECPHDEQGATCPSCERDYSLRESNPRLTKVEELIKRRATLGQPVRYTTV